MIQSVNSNTSLTLDKPFAETTATNSNYRILLNTAAHFPSDTAAKVERALEQLSDINEAAINNDRTVTAATQVNGKGIESTTGYINLNPPSVNSNDGGSLRFHYNQSSSITSSIYEDESGRIRLSGNINIIGNVNSRLNLDSNDVTPLKIRRSGLVKGTAPSAITYTVIPFYGNVMNDNSNSRVAMIQHAVDTNNVSSLTLAAYGCNSTTDSTVSSIRCFVDGDGNAYTSAPTPASDDKSTKIATTSFVDSKLKAVKALGANYVMNIDDFGTTAGGYTCSSLDTSVAGNFIPSVSGTDIGDYRFWAEGVSGSYKTILAFSPRLSDGFYMGRFWNKVWEGWRKITAIDVSSKDDTTLGGGVTTEVSAATGTVVTIGTIELTKGLYLVQLVAFWGANANGYRQIGLATSATSQNIDRYSIQKIPAINATNSSAYNSLVVIIPVSAATATYYVNVYQNSGSTLTANGGIRYLKLR